MTEQEHIEAKTGDNPWLALAEEVDALPQGPLPSLDGLSVRRRLSAWESWVQSFLNGNIPVYVLCFVAMAFICPPKAHPLGLFLSTLLLFPLMWLFRPVLFHGRRASRLTFFIGIVYSGLIAGVSTLFGEELARKLIFPKFRFLQPEIYALRVQEKMELFFSPSYLLVFLIPVILTTVLLSKIKKDYVWMDQDIPRTAVVIICLLLTTIIPLGTTASLVARSAWTAEEKAWLDHAHQAYGDSIPKADAHSPDSPWSALLDEAEKAGYKQWALLSESEAANFTDKVLGLWERPGRRSKREVEIIHGFSNALLNSPNSHPRRLDLARILLELRFSNSEIGSSYLSQAALTADLIPYFMQAPLSEIEKGGWEKDLVTWRDQAEFDLETLESVVYSYMVREHRMAYMHEGENGQSLDGIPLRLFGQEFSPSPTQLMVRYRMKSTLESWQKVKAEYEALEPRELHQRVLQQMSKEGSWQTVHADIYYALYTLNFIPALEISLFVIEARRQHELTGTWPASRDGLGWEYDQNDRRISLKSGTPKDLAESETWILE